MELPSLYIFQWESTAMHEDSMKGFLIAESKEMQKVLCDLEKIAKSHANVFITGESGTGKEIVSSWIHRFSLRNKAPFIKVNCAAMSESLIESEFFGHERGPFTGALHRKLGRLELADHGTILLDEVTEIPLNLQAKLLRAIQEKEFERVGSTNPIRVDVRFLATSNRNMQEAIENKIFREDLFFRLNVVPIRIPPLRERKKDILPLAHAFLEKFCRENHKPLITLDLKAKNLLQDHTWPGNIRELANLMERTVVLCQETEIKESDLKLDKISTLQCKISLFEVEKELIIRTLEKTKGNKTQAAQILGISIRTLRNKLDQYLSSNI